MWFEYPSYREPFVACSQIIGILSLMVVSQWTQTSLRNLQDVLKRSRGLMTKPDVVKTSGRRRLIYDVLKTSDL